MCSGYVKNYRDFILSSSFNKHTSIKGKTTMKKLYLCAIALSSLIYANEGGISID
ncbi:hypothetical protein OJP33_07075 [Campylobacter lari]|uniref:hypothetical protein n=1 Tax=Campylobacter lari TaxID=201 RepID=UPI0021F70501|nr:hypothetical protein [Campylobacter lari]MCW0224471.1 hypothetical protein [Campylobacter lari]